MTTRRFTDDLPEYEPDNSYEEPELPPEPEPEPSRRASAQRNSGRSNAHMPRTLAQVMNDANERVVRGDLVDYVPMPTGFDPLDGFIGGGLRKTELVLLGGAQGIGKTIATLQIARNIAMRPDQFAFYLSYEHTETHLMHRLLCMESINPPEIDINRGIKLRDLYQIIVAQRAKGFMGRDGGGGVAPANSGRERQDIVGPLAGGAVCRPADIAQGQPGSDHVAHDQGDDGAVV